VEGHQKKISALSNIKRGKHQHNFRHSSVEMVQPDLLFAQLKREHRLQHMCTWRKLLWLYLLLTTYYLHKGTVCKFRRQMLLIQNNNKWVAC